MSESHPLGTKAWNRVVATFGNDRAFCGQQARDKAGCEPAPGVLLFCEDTAQVSFALRITREQGIPLLVRGSGSGLALEGLRDLEPAAYVMLDTSRLRGVDDIQSDALWMSAQAGTRLADLVAAAERVKCRPIGFDADRPGTLGGWLARHARIPDCILGIPQPAVVGIEAVLPSGVPIRSVPSPRSAAGPDVFSLLLGTRGAFGVITSACIKLEPVPERRLLAGFRFRSMERAFGFVRASLDGIVPPGQLQLMLDGQKGRRLARVWFAIEGQADLAAAAMRALRRRAETLGGRAEDLERVRSWRDGTVFAGRQVFEASVRWSSLPGVLRGADRLMDGFAFAVLDRPGLDGCRIRLAAARKKKGDLRPGWRRLVDPKGQQLMALNQARAVMERVRCELDPKGLLNPQARTLPWVGDLG